MTRRQLLFLPGACSLLGQAPRHSEAQNLSFPLQSIEGITTPADLFFVRDHFSEPEVSLRSYRLKVEGRVSQPIELTLADIIESPTSKIEAVLECAGNAAGGSAVSNGVWEGVSFSYFLRQAGVESRAKFVVLEGADSGRLTTTSPDLPYSQVVPIEKCMRPESLLAFKLNDRFLPRKNGFPVRALFPGWYAMDSVKWLQRIRVLGEGESPSDFEASGMNKLYNRVSASGEGEPSITRLTELMVKSAVAWPSNEAKLPAARHVVRGFAWTGSGVIRKVEVSQDGGREWARAKLENRAKPLSWVRWNYEWEARPGDHVLMSRATDDAGRQQPLVRDRTRKDGYEMNYCVPVRCSVR